MVVDKSGQADVDVKNIESGYSISRRMAARLLGVSTRTVDRYVRDSKLSTVTIDGRIWLNKREIGDMRVLKKYPSFSSGIGVSTLNMSIDKVVDSSVDSVDTVNTVDRQVSTKKENGLYKKSELFTKIEEQQEKINIINSKIGQLEYRLKNSISITSHQLKTLSYEIENRTMERFLNRKEKEFIVLNNKYKKIYVKKYIFFVLFLILLSLQPLWILVHFDKFF